MALCRFSSVYLLGGPRVGAEMGALETAEVEVGMPLPLVGALGALPVSSSLPVGGGLLQGLRQVCWPAILFG